MKKGDKESARWLPVKQGDTERARWLPVKQDDTERARLPVRGVYAGLNSGDAGSPSVTKSKQNRGDGL